ncbi:MAG: HAD family phosphatase [Rikenellaceae bacterium]
MTRAVIFDMDGVLVDNREVHIDSFMEWCHRFGVEMGRDALHSYFGMGNDEIFPAVLGRDDLSPREIARFSDEKEAIYREMFADNITPTAGLIDMLEGLRSRGILMAVGSSGMRKNVDFVLDKCGIREYFTEIVDGDQLHRAKPDPEVFLLGAERLGVPCSEVLVFEDSYAGIAAARAAGMKVVALATTFARETHSDFDLLVDDFTQTSAEEVLAL